MGLESDAPIAIIGGSGLDQLEGFHPHAERALETPYGNPSGSVLLGRLEGVDVCFLARHGPGHRIAPHRINYRANLWALRKLGVARIIAVAAVGGIRASLLSGTVVVPHQLVDYTWGREGTFTDPPEGTLEHIDFTEPYSSGVRAALLAAADDAGVDRVDGGVYGVTQGPRLETAAEIDRMERDGCDLVGMTGMPEAALARECGIEYGCLALVVNAAAGRGSPTISLAGIEAVMAEGMRRVRRILPAALARLSER